MKEKEVEIILWQWLKDCPNVFEVYFNRKNEIKAPIFKVNGKSKEIPDLILACSLFGKSEYIAIEVKNGDDGINVIKSNKILNLYYNNYITNKTKYFIGDKEIKISKFLVATQFSKLGRLIRDNEIIIKNGSGFENDSWINKNVPLNEYSRTKDFYRMLIHDFSDYRKKNKIKESPGIGILISDIILEFSLKELQMQSGMIGKPIIQGVFFNNKFHRWQQCLMKI